jgi:hypothetical protein
VALIIPGSAGRGGLSTVERAHQLAGSGECACLLDIQARLKAEGYEDYLIQLYGRAIRLTLRRLCREHFKPAP